MSTTVNSSNSSVDLIKQQLKNVDGESSNANNNAEVVPQLTSILSELNTLKSTIDTTDSNYANVNAMISDVQNMMTAAGQAGSTAVGQNATFSSALSDVESLATQFTSGSAIQAPTTVTNPNTTGATTGTTDGQGAGTQAYVMMDIPGIPANSDLGQIAPKLLQVNYIGDAKPPIYIASGGDVGGSSTSSYIMFDANGKKISPPGGMQDPFAINLGNGNYYASSPKGTGSAWETTDPASLDKTTQMYALSTTTSTTGDVSTNLVEKGVNTGPVATGTTTSDGSSTSSNASASGNTTGTGPTTGSTNGQGAGTAAYTDGNIPGIDPKSALGSIAGNVSQVNYLGDAKPPMYIVSGGGSGGSSANSYLLFDAKGNKLTPPGGLTDPFAINLGNGNWYASSASGVSQAWETTNTDSLDSKYNLYDMTGPTGAPLKNLGLNQQTFNSNGSAKDPAKTNGGHSQTDRANVDSGGWTLQWAGSSTSKGTVYANVDSKDGNKRFTLKDEQGNMIMPADLSTGQYGTFSFSNGATYVASSQGYFMMDSDGSARNILTGQAMTQSQMRPILASATTADMPRETQDNAAAPTSSTSSGDNLSRASGK